jgi:hypothetical protein
MYAAQRVCFWLTLVHSVPYMIVLIGALWLIPSLLGILISSVQFLFSAFFAMFLFVHSSDADAD